MRVHSSSSTIENGFVYLPEKAEWLGEYLHEFRLFPKEQARRSGRFHITGPRLGAPAGPTFIVPHHLPF
jgi:hypothetical protein